MTANELLALLGLAWPRLLLYPGGLAAFALIWLISRPATDDRRPTTDDQRPTKVSGARWSMVGGRWSVLDSRLEISAVVLPWLGLALLPLPGVASISRQTDIIAVLALLEWPVALAVAAELREARAGAPTRAARRLAAALNSYPPLILATLTLASAAGSFDTTALARPPDDSTPANSGLLHWIGAIAWVLALPPALGIGAFAAGLPQQRALRVGLRLRALGLVALAALPWFPLVGGDGASAAPFVAFMWLALPPLVIAAALWGYDRLTAGHPARRWARVYLLFDLVLLLVLLWAASTALQARLV